MPFNQKIHNMMDLIPVVFIAFKALVFGIGMFFAIKWHYDQDKQNMTLRAVLFTGTKLAGVFVLAAVVLVFITFAFARWLGMDLSLP